MRYFRLIIVALLVFVSFKMVYTDPQVTVITHTYIQEDLKNIIQIAIEDALPDAKEIRFERMNTENLAENQVKANFIYGFTSTSEIGDHRIEIEGSAVLNRFESEGNLDSWSLDSIQLGDESLDFQEPIIIEVEN